MVLVDSTVWIDYLNGTWTVQTQWLDREVSRQRLGLLDIVLCEVLQGLRQERRFRDARSALLRFEVLASGGVELAVATAVNHRALRARGRTVRATIDAWIATFCLLHGHHLLHNDHDFDHFEQILGLQVILP